MNMKLGPNKVGHYYQPAPYHGYKAKKLNDKTRWIANAKFEYDIFNLADEHDERVLRDEPLVRNLRWVNDDNKGLYSIKENGCILGISGERLAYFPQPRNEGESWHGYPTDSTNLGDKLINHWFSIGVIDISVCRKLLKHKL